MKHYTLTYKFKLSFKLTCEVHTKKVYIFLLDLLNLYSFWWHFTGILAFYFWEFFGKLWRFMPKRDSKNIYINLLQFEWQFNASPTYFLMRVILLPAFQFQPFHTCRICKLFNGTLVNTNLFYQCKSKVETVLCWSFAFG